MSAAARNDVFGRQWIADRVGPAADGANTELGEFVAWQRI
jgi:hypothetical protein